jgi:hypothetical protein
MTIEGKAFVFLAVDSFSEFVFSIGVASTLNDTTIIKHLKLLTENMDFKNGLLRQKSFTIVLSDYEHILPELNEMVKPLGGKVVINKEYFTKVTKPVIKALEVHMK